MCEEDSRVSRCEEDSASAVGGIRDPRSKSARIASDVLAEYSNNPGAVWRMTPRFGKETPVRSVSVSVSVTDTGVETAGVAAAIKATSERKDPERKCISTANHITSVRTCATENTCLGRLYGVITVYGLNEMNNTPVIHNINKRPWKLDVISRVDFQTNYAAVTGSLFIPQDLEALRIRPVAALNQRRL